MCDVEWRERRIILYDEDKKEIKRNLFWNVGVWDVYVSGIKDKVYD